MAFRAFFTGDEVINMLDFQGDDEYVDEDFFPGSDEEFGTQEEEEM